MKALVVRRTFHFRGDCGMGQMEGWVWILRLHYNFTSWGCNSAQDDRVAAGCRADKGAAGRQDYKFGGRVL